MDTNVITTDTRIDLTIDLALRASDSLLVRLVGGFGVTETGAVCPAVMGAVSPVSVDGAPAQLSYDACPSVVPTPIKKSGIAGMVKGQRVAAGMTHPMSNRGKAATKFSTRLGRKTCSPPV